MVLPDWMSPLVPRASAGEGLRESWGLAALEVGQETTKEAARV